jgi:phosphoglucosamine mutase
MREGGFNLGGEQSGHIIMGQHGTTGDGIIAALQVLAALLASGRKPASETLRVFQAVPQLLRNVRLSQGTNADAVLGLDAVKSAIAAVQKRLNGHGRLVIRKSGTEPLIRIMAEGDDAKEVDTVVAELAAVITKAAA